MEITYYGHACFLVEINSTRLLFDPFITPNALAKHINLSHIKCDFILVSHGHEDHIADCITLAQTNQATVISNFEICVWLQKKGVHNVHMMNTGGHWIFPFGKIKCVNAIHSSSLPDGSYGGNPMGFLVESGRESFYYSGDTALTLDMQLIGDYKNIKVALLPIGNNFTMGIDNAVIASQFIKCDKIIGLHYDTFDMIKIDHRQAKQTFSAAGKELYLLTIGETISI